MRYGLSPEVVCNGVLDHVADGAFFTGGSDFEI